MNIDQNSVTPGQETYHDRDERRSRQEQNQMKSLRDLKIDMLDNFVQTDNHSNLIKRTAQMKPENYNTYKLLTEQKNKTSRASPQVSPPRSPSPRSVNGSEGGLPVINRSPSELQRKAQVIVELYRRRPSMFNVTPSVSTPVKGTRKAHPFITPKQKQNAAFQRENLGQIDFTDQGYFSPQSQEEWDDRYRHIKKGRNRDLGSPHAAIKTDVYNSIYKHDHDSVEWEVKNQQELARQRRLQRAAPLKAYYDQQTKWKAQTTKNTNQNSAVFDHSLKQSVLDRKVESDQRGHAEQLGRLQNYHDNLALEKVLKDQQYNREKEEFLQGYKHAYNDMQEAKKLELLKKQEVNEKKNSYKEEMMNMMETKKFEQLQRLKMQRQNSQNFVSMTQDPRSGAMSALNNQFEKRRNTIMAARTDTYNTPEMSIDLVGTNPFVKYQNKHIQEHQQKQYQNQKNNNNNMQAYDGKSLMTHSQSLKQVEEKRQRFIEARVSELDNRRVDQIYDKKAKSRYALAENNRVNDILLLVNQDQKAMKQYTIQQEDKGRLAKILEDDKKKEDIDLQIKADKKEKEMETIKHSFLNKVEKDAFAAKMYDDEQKQKLLRDKPKQTFSHQIRMDN